MRAFSHRLKKSLRSKNLMLKRHKTPRAGFERITTLKKISRAFAGAAV
jgi:hypothetical protein